MDPGCGLLLVIQMAVLGFFVLCCVYRACCLPYTAELGYASNPAGLVHDPPARFILWVASCCLGVDHSPCMHVCVLAVLRRQFVWLGPQV